jgi:hypothetical protein
MSSAGKVVRTADGKYELALPSKDTFIQQLARGMTRKEVENALQNVRTVPSVAEILVSLDRIGSADFFLEALQRVEVDF